MACHVIKNTTIVTTLQSQLMTTAAHAKWLNLQVIYISWEKADLMWHV